MQIGRVSARKNRGQQVAVLIKLKRYDQARQAAVLLRDSDDGKAFAYYALGQLDRLQGVGDGKTAFTAAADVPAEDSTGLETRAVARACLGAYAAAFDDAAEIKRTAESDPNSGDPDLEGNAAYAALYALRAASPDAQPGDRNKALYFAGMRQVVNPLDSFKFPNWTELQSLARDPLFLRLVDATNVPLNQPDRYLKLAAFEAALGADPKGDNAIACELAIGPLLDRALALGWDPAVPLVKDAGNELLTKSKPFQAMLKTPSTTQAN